ncbi:MULTISPECIES: class I SAM-dependent methyltransferase [Ensifer]|jgi:2-polyprenyl-3-methyl-5-hydroxy-6-metoxy-1,4-benzoquinol methylase|uniref:Methyltransferase domain-containing protein n=1 Tax=Ensifer canadensis TaxID=555315 RepID=A0AAW4FQ59_9HYPH|nr:MULTISPECIES: class I SAM-dependent methyltransferase [Ensifer]MDP9630821.1 2-polyprenyl-3-methyl-5-hydroxy-6-metoxy-1,4-benzoquinol methylase [Ensifer adhaerens]KQU86177.1 SAM-dependent methyltransferase [Ensifer sp. Root31]KQW58740.1 SAM-dependent methyltransferase [Ensifer sp. Root1252]KQW74443.1 SAM-dependent methyltransferase [Ensifer sp. Root127]KQY62148.1 SAM-dependent methyltransferase [Ensifer sp. Root142]
MSDDERRAHWDAAYASKDEAGVSWFEGTPEVSLRLIHEYGRGLPASLIDIGGGASRLVDRLLEEGGWSVAVLDLSPTALGAARARLGARGEAVEWIAADVTDWSPSRQYDIWHDRAAFHFLTGAAERAAYVERLCAAVKPSGHAIIATFAPDGPNRCSGLPVMRYDPAALAEVIGPSFRLVEAIRHQHKTPWNSVQAFQFSALQRVR